MIFYFIHSQTVQFGYAKHYNVLSILCNLNSKMTPLHVVCPPGKGVAELPG